MMTSVKTVCCNHKGIRRTKRIPKSSFVKFGCHDLLVRMLAGYPHGVICCHIECQKLRLNHRLCRRYKLVNGFSPIY